MFSSAGFGRCHGAMLDGRESAVPRASDGGRTVRRRRLWPGGGGGGPHRARPRRLLLLHPVSPAPCLRPSRSRLLTRLTRRPSLPPSRALPSGRARCSRSPSSPRTTTTGTTPAATPRCSRGHTRAERAAGSEGEAAPLVQRAAAPWAPASLLPLPHGGPHAALLVRLRCVIGCVLCVACRPLSLSRQAGCVEPGLSSSGISRAAHTESLSKGCTFHMYHTFHGCSPYEMQISSPTQMRRLARHTNSGHEVGSISALGSEAEFR